MPIFSNFAFIFLINMFMHLWHLESIDQVDRDVSQKSYSCYFFDFSSGTKVPISITCPVFRIFLISFSPF